MLQRKNRFSGLGSVRPALKYGQRIRGRNVAASVLKGRKQHSRFSVLVSKKVSKKAATRNRIRRRVMSVLEQEIPKLIDQPYDVVISVFDKNLANCPYDELYGEVKLLLKKARLYS